jgi:hypothetical protein
VKQVWYGKWCVPMRAHSLRHINSRVDIRRRDRPVRLFEHVHELGVRVSNPERALGRRGEGPAESGIDPRSRIRAKSLRATYPPSPSRSVHRPWTVGDRPFVDEDSHRGEEVGKVLLDHWNRLCL